jgi:hypothetical protein
VTFTAAELTGMRDTQEAFMSDACQIGTVTTSQNDMGELVADEPSYGAEIPCGLQMTGGLQSAERRTADGTIVNADAKLRLPHDAVISVTNVVKITKRHGTAITPMVYEVMGVPAVGPSGIVCYLLAVTT